MSRLFDMLFEKTCYLAITFSFFQNEKIKMVSNAHSIIQKRRDAPNIDGDCHY